MKAPSQRNLGLGSMQPMVAINQIEKFGRQIGEQFGAEQVILFGSYAQGSVTADSDVDL
jgi:predicted nucleotidyltransferase